MNQEQRARFFEHLDYVHNAEKELDSIPEWTLKPDRQRGRLTWFAAVKLNGVLGGGVSVRITTPADVWEHDVYGQIEINSIETLRRTARILPVEWRSIKDHRNPPIPDSEHSRETYRDRWHPYDKNRDLQNPAIFFQDNVTGIAFPLPLGITTFLDYLNFCSRVWKCPSIEEIPTPPWSPKLI